MKKTVYALVGLILIVGLYIIVQLIQGDKIKYKERLYELRNDEYGLMLFNENNGGEFSVVNVLHKDETYLISIYSFQDKKLKWVKLKADNRMFDIDSSDYNFNGFKEIDNQALLKR